MRKSVKRVFGSLVLALSLVVTGVAPVSAKEGATEIFLRAEDYDKEKSERTELKQNFDNKGNSAVVTDEEGQAAWTFEVKKAGSYFIKVAYYTVSGVSMQMERRVLLDGEQILQGNTAFKRSYSIVGDKKYDKQGNQMRSEEKENLCWQESYLANANRYEEEPYAFELSEGQHTLVFESVLDSMAIGQITLTTEKEACLSYEKVLKEQQKQGIQDARIDCRKVQAENYAAKSDASILVQNDKSSAATEPSSPSVVVYNTIGGSSWSEFDQWVEWKIEAPEDGWYEIGMRFRQNTKIGGVSSRSLKIDGHVPFEEAGQLSFPYDNSWKVSSFGEDTPYRFYLTKGEHTIRLTVNIGKLVDVLAKTEDLVNELNEMYMQIIMVSGTSPDLKRDYNFKALIPEVIEEYHTVSKKIGKLIKEINQITDGSQKVSDFESMQDLLEELYKDPESTAKRMSDFSSHITTLASWVSDSRKQPLEVDYLFLAQPEGELPKAGGGFLKSLWFQIKRLIASYTIDYTSIGSTEEGKKDQKPLRVWVIAGTEQAQVIQKLINEEFVAKKGIPVKMQNVAEGALMPAIFAGTGPDVVLNLTEAAPVNYALRGVVANLNEFDDIDKVLSQYEPCAYEAFQSDGGLYALPTALDYPVLFYRKDVLSEMGIDLKECETWDTMLQSVLPKLQMKNLKFGLTPSLNSYLSFYYQGGYNLYSEDHLNIMLDSREGVNAFRKYSSIYTDYKQDMTFNFVNLFRSGEMQISVGPYSQYYQLSAFAPEIEGQWGMMLVPGTLNADGTVNHAAACTVTGASILSATKMKDQAWEFLKWWAGDEAQIAYARNIETVLGLVGRVSPASNAARATIPWTKEVQALLKEQLSYCRGVPQVPGSYYVERYFGFAFRDVVYDGKDIVQTLISITDDIDTEIREKTIELQGQK